MLAGDVMTRAVVPGDTQDSRETAQATRRASHSRHLPTLNENTTIGDASGQIPAGAHAKPGLTSGRDVVPTPDTPPLAVARSGGPLALGPIDAVHHLRTVEALHRDGPETLAALSEVAL